METMKAAASSFATRFPSPRFVNIYATFIFFFVFAGQAYRNLLSWWGFGALSLIIFIVLTFVYMKRRSFLEDMKRIPFPLILFLGWCMISVSWSEYVWESVLGVAIQFISAATGFMLCFLLSWGKVMMTLSNALKWILGLSIVFELFASVVMQQALYPLFPPENQVPWTNNDLFHGGPIQGIVANRNLLGFIAILLGVIVIIQFLHTKHKPITAASWLVACAGTILLTDSATVTLSVFAVTAVVAAVLVMRKFLPATHKYAYYVLTALLLTGISVSIIYSSTLFSLLGRDSTASGRSSIWRSVIDLSLQHPVEGWGWIGYWAPWVEPFKNLAVIDGIVYLQAHNALLDIWLQTGFVGVSIALLVAIVASIRAWRIAVAPTNPKMEAFAAISFFPLMMVTLLLVQSLAESRLLIEGNWVLLVIVCCKVKLTAPPYGSLKKNSLT